MKKEMGELQSLMERNSKLLFQGMGSLEGDITKRDG